MEWNGTEAPFSEFQRTIALDGLGLKTLLLGPTSARQEFRQCVQCHMLHALSSIIHVDTADLCLIQMLSVVATCIMQT